MRMETACLSKPRRRKNNQDSYVIEIRGMAGCWRVAEGVGGHAGGETASHMAVDVVLSQFRSERQALTEFVETCFQNVQQKIRAKADDDLVLSAMRTTLVVLACDCDQVYWGHVGDTRLYLFRDGKILYQTRDHSVPQMLVDAGRIAPGEIRGHEDQNRLTKALGQEGELKAAVAENPLKLKAGDAALLCSDGIWTYVLEQELELMLAESASAEDWLAAVERLVLERAEKDHDNYTAVAVLFSESADK